MKIIETKSGIKFKPGDFAYVKRLFEIDRIGMIIRYCGSIEPYETIEEKKTQEIYEVLIGKKMSLYNEVLLLPLDNQIMKKIVLKSKN